jgi:hypothetical protein
VDTFAFASETTTQLIAAGAALGGVIIGGVITLIVTVLQNRHARSERLAAAAVARRDRAAVVLGRVRTWLNDVTPERIGINVNAERTPQELDALSVRLNSLRDELSVFALADEDDRVMDRAGRLEIALFNTFHQVSWHASDLLRNRDALGSLDIARWWHLRATILVRMVLDLVRGRDVAKIESALRDHDKTKPN